MLSLILLLFSQIHGAIEEPIKEPLTCEHKIIEKESITNDPEELLLLKRGRTTTRQITQDPNALYAATHKITVRDYHHDTEETIYIFLRAPLLFHAIILSAHPYIIADAALQEWMLNIIKILCEEKGADINQEITCTLASGGQMTLNPLIAAINHQAPETIIRYLIDHTTTLTKRYPYKFDAYTALYYLIERYKDIHSIENLLEKMVTKKPDLLHIKNKTNISLIRFALEHKKYWLVYHIYDHMKEAKQYKEMKKSKQLKNEFIDEVISYIFDSFGTEIIDHAFEFSLFIRKHIAILIDKKDDQGRSLLYRLASCNTEKEMEAREKQDALIFYLSRDLFSDETYRGNSLMDAARKAHCSSVVHRALEYRNEQSPHRRIPSPIIYHNY